MNAAERAVHAVIRHHSKSFSLAARLLPRAVAADAVVLYAYCRRADDAIDLAPGTEQAASAARLRRELDAVYGPRDLEDPLLSLFQSVVRRRAIPRLYLDELIAGFEMDVVNVEYETFAELLCYCYRVAGTVGLMMCHVMGVRAVEALPRAAHLGIAMQLTNVARDVGEDWERGRLYLPEEILAESGVPGLRAGLGGGFPRTAAAATARAIGVLLDRADAFYRSGNRGLSDLAPRCSLAVRTASLVYARIGDEIRARACDPLAGRAVVSGRRKASAVGRAVLATAAALPDAWRRPPTTVPAAPIADPAALLLEPLAAPRPNGSGARRAAR